MFARDRYLKQLIAFQDKDLVKVVTGVRRCGKSTLLELMREHLLNQGVAPERIFMFKMESLEYADLSYKELYQLIQQRTAHINHPYLFFDELQEVAGWERVINALRVDRACDIYITGSNAHLLSSEISTLLSGRYVEIEMQPLVFSEYLDFKGAALAQQAAADAGIYELRDGTLTTFDQLFQEYRRFGGWPYLVQEPLQEEVHRTYMRSLFNTVVVRDALERDKRRELRTLTDPDLLTRICDFLADNVGNENSINSITSAVRADGKVVSNQTVDAYIQALAESYLFYPLRRFDIKGKSLLKTGGKHYMVDSGLRNYLLGYRDSDQGRVFENIVFKQLRFEGYELHLGKLRQGEVDFVATHADEKIYIQVCEDMTAQETLERELRPLRAIADAYPKMVVVLRGSYPTNIDGIKIVPASDFLRYQETRGW